MRVLSVFDGCAVTRQAFKNLGMPVEYFASEIDKYAIKIASKNHPDIVQLGDVKEVTPFEVDLLIGGSPCQDLSAAGNAVGLYGQRSGLFFEFVRLLEAIKPKYFVLENVASMKKKWKDEITRILGVEPVMINSALVSAQSRKRLYWTNFTIEQPEDRGILLRDVIESGVVDRDKSFCIDANYWKGTTAVHYATHHLRQVVFLKQDSIEIFDSVVKAVQLGYINKNQQGRRFYSTEAKAVSLKANGGGWGAKMGLYLDKDHIRKLTPIECERLQTLPDNYTEGVSRTQRYKMLGNAFTCAVIEHILRSM